MHVLFEIGDVFDACNRFMKELTACKKGRQSFHAAVCAYVDVVRGHPFET